MPDRVAPGPEPPGPAPLASGVLARDFLARPSHEVAPELLGCVLVHEAADGTAAVELTEVEAYEGPLDPASHSYRGRTPRNAVMGGPPGFAYVYFTYGMHFCVNVVCQPAGTPSAVLLRAGRLTAGEEVARRRRAARRPAGPARPADPPGHPDAARPADPPGHPDAARSPVPARALPARDLARGPGRLCQALAITREQGGLDLLEPASPLRLYAAYGPAPAVSVGPRVGISVAVDIPWRFWLTGDPTVSPYRPGKPRQGRPPRPDR